MLTVMSFFVTIAAIFYIARSVLDMFEKHTVQQIEEYLRRAEELHEDTAREIETSFDLWWADEASAIVRHSLREKVVVPPQLAEMVPEELLESMFAPAMEHYRQQALALAVHACTKEARKRLISQLPSYRDIRASALAKTLDSDHGLAEIKRSLMEVGIDPDALVTNFEEY